MMRAEHDIGVEYHVQKALNAAEIKEGKREWHFNYDE